MSSIDKYLRENKSQVVDDLKELLRIPSVSTLPEHNADCLRAADWVVGEAKRIGFKKVKKLGPKTQPVVVADSPTIKGAPRVIVYGHYDVQPPDPLDLWKTPPFEPAVKSGKIFARGAADDKGQFLAVMKGLEAASSDGRMPVNVRLMIEGQEEIGSEGIAELVASNPELAEADAVLVADTPFYAPGIPAVYSGLRGMCYAEVRVKTLASDLHSGMYGGVAPNAHETLVRILSGLKSQSGRIRIPGLYEAVERPSRKILEGWKKLPFSESRFRKEEVGAKQLTGIQRYTALERIWALPTLEIHGIMGGFTGEGAKTVIPSEATAKISLRLVPGQKEKTVRRQLTAAIKALAPSFADVEVSFVHGADPVSVDVESPVFDVISTAFEDVFGRAPAYIRSGGSIPIVAQLASRGAAVILAGIGLPDDGLHAPNEKLDLKQYHNGIRAYGRFFKALGA